MNKSTTSGRFYGSKFADLKHGPKTHLVKQLLDNHGSVLNNRTPRNRIIEALGQEISRKVEREGKPVDILFDILQTCNDYLKLLDFFSALDVEEAKDGALLLEYQVYIEKLFIINEIIKLLSKSLNKELDDPSHINNIYKKSLPTAITIHERPQETNIAMAIDHLSGYSRKDSDGSFPLLNFISLLDSSGDKKHLNNDLSNLTKELLERSLSLSEDDKKYIENFFLQKNEGSINSQSDSLDLLIQVKLERTNNTRSSVEKYSTSFYEWRSALEEPNQIASFKKVSGENIKLKIISVLQKYLKQSDDLKPKLHFFLPTTLMHLDIDQWEYDSGNEKPSVLADDNHVIIRSSLVNLLPAKSTKYEKQVKARLKSKAINPLQISNQEGLEFKLKRSENEDVNMIFFSFPVKCGDREVFEVLSSPEIGMPIAVWIRESSFNNFCPQQLGFDQLKNVDHILDMIRDLRLRAREEEAKSKGSTKLIGSYISLFLEDPNRFIKVGLSMTPQQSNSLRPL